MLLDTETTRVTRSAAGGVRSRPATATTITAEEVLVATGRTPRTGDIGLDTDRPRPRATGSTTDDTMLVRGFDWLYAVGDVTHRALLTHQGKYQARAAGDVIAARAHGSAGLGRAVGRPRRDRRPPGRSAGHVHRTRGRLRRTDRARPRATAGYDIRVVDYEIGQVAGASVRADGYTGTARMVVDEERKVLLGVTFVGPDVSELLHAATIAVVGEVPLDRLWHAVPAYPTVSEIWLRLLEAYGRPTVAHQTISE